MTSTAVRVGLRVRPLTEKEIMNNCTECISFIPNTPQILIGADKSFTYDYVFNNKTDQSQVYQQAASPLLHKFIDGFNATILAYGQTGSGKTYSMGTTLKDNSENEGIVPRCIIELFEILKANEKQDPDFKYEVYVSFLELYNEEFIDLLTITSKRKSYQPQTTEVSIREDVTGQIYWSGVKEEICYSPQDVLNFLIQGSLHRTTGSTEMNSVSSRSHAIFSLILKQQKTQEEEGGKKVSKSLTSKFHFVDLAGSERLKRTHAQGDRAKEGIAINSGLLALGNVISALGDEARKMTHIPYRDSKLTRLLQDSLGGNSQTLMLACVSPADTNFQETLSTLKYANRARNIKNRVCVNQEFTGSSAEVGQLKALVSKLRIEIAELRAGQQPAEKIKEMTAQIVQLTNERDTLLLERELNEFKQCDEDTLLENIGSTRTVQTHPIIEKYQKMNEQLQSELQDAHDKLKMMQDERHALQKFSHPLVQKKPTKSNSNPRRRAIRRPIVNTSASLRKKHNNKRSNKKSVVMMEEEDDEGFVNDFQEQDIVRHEEVKESIAKVRADIRKSLQELVKPLENPSWEDELKVFEKEENNLHKQDENMYSLNIEEFIQDIESFTIPTWKQSERKDSFKSDSSDESTVQSRLSQQQTCLPHSKFTSQLSRMLHQIQSDIKVKEELVSHLEKSEVEYTFMRKKFDERISLLQAQLVDIQKEKDMALTRAKSNVAVKTDVKHQVEPEIRQVYEQKIKQLSAKIQDLTRKYSSATTSVQSARHQNESALKTLKTSIHRLETEKKRLVQRMRMEAERVREKMLRQERKIQQLQRQQAQCNQAKKRLEREHEEQKIILKKQNEEILMSTSQLKQMMSVMKKAVREGGILDEKMLAKLTPVMGGSFAVIARGGGHGFPKKKKKNPVPLGIRVSRKKQLLDKALSQYIQGKQAIVEMENLLIRRERLVKEKIDLEEEREQVYYLEREHEENTGQPMDTIAIELMDERIDLVSAEISYLSTRVRSLQKEAAEESLQAEEQLDTVMIHRPTKHVTFVDEIVTEMNHDEQQWMDIDTFDEQFTVPINAAPEVAHDICCKLIKSFETDECHNIIENLVDDIMELKMSEYEKQTTVKDMEQTILDLRRTLEHMKQNNEQSILNIMTKKDTSSNINNNTINLNCDTNINNNTQLISLPNSPVASPYNNTNLQPPKIRRDSITPSPDRFYNLIQTRLSWQQQQSENIQAYISDHDSSTSSIRSSHLRRSSVQSDASIQQQQTQEYEHQYQQKQPQEYQPQHQRPSPLQKLIKKAPTNEKLSSVFYRLAQTPTRSSKAKITYRHSSGSVEELKMKWEPVDKRPQSAIMSHFI
ncbi:hypothetical protein G6F16_005409 [Rhizopus arrhizus]|nr:hypothetical protein G6F23_003480 [Rhizopus arrhizus]KAG0766251.1 hypothetical protein G6F24_003750 [Rhizopus arrhizus]KAG0787563.1 hypothetical protein G6F21_007819 [Rhizopus arrhizus]KAG0809787.1 hypothetical protein G6F20_008492 [Rhizopus arrhizus]KAG0829045.1 hypothetical protein G6F18_008782 [Rhizopus arrhizus]